MDAQHTSSKTRNLIYYSLGGHVQYIDMFRMHINSLKSNNDIDADVLVITNSRFVDLMIHDPDFSQVHYMLADTEGVEKSSCKKISIYKYDLSLYDKVFFCDIDTLWVDKVSKVFEVITPDKIHFSTEKGFMCESIYHGKDLMTEDEIIAATNDRVPALNFGTFGFSASIAYVFERLEEYIDDNIGMMNVCLEQPFGNVFMYRNDLYSTSLDSVVSNGDTSNPKVLMHFLGGPGNYESKFIKMCGFLGG